MTFTVAVDVARQTIQPTYTCGTNGPTVDMRHGERFAIARVEKQHELHTWKGNQPRCHTCAAAADALTADEEFVQEINRIAKAVIARYFANKALDKLAAELGFKAA